jgi:cytochrome c-type biogenesis protein CcmE
VDLTPGVATPVRRRSRLAYAVLLVVVLALGVVVYQALSSASLYFYNADEAVAQRDELGDKRFRLQGTVLGDTIDETSDGVEFTVAFNGVRVEAHHDGDPPELFQPGIPVVLEGRWSESGDWFASDRILVKHSEEYEADNSDRIDDARDGEGDDADDSPSSP